MQKRHTTVTTRQRRRRVPTITATTSVTTRRRRRVTYHATTMTTAPAPSPRAPAAAMALLPHYPSPVPAAPPAWALRPLTLPAPSAGPTEPPNGAAACPNAQPRERYLRLPYWNAARRPRRETGCWDGWTQGGREGWTTARPSQHGDGSPSPRRRPRLSCTPSRATPSCSARRPLIHPVPTAQRRERPPQR